MTPAIKSGLTKPRGKAKTLASRFRRSTQGTTAIEFAMVALPFMMMLFGIMGIGLFYFTTFSLENAVERAARLVRTGQVEAANMSEADFKAQVCQWAPVFVDCDNNLKVFVQAFPDNATDLTPIDCVDGDGLTSASLFDTGGADQVVLVTACYEWTLSEKIPFLEIGNIGGTRKRLIQAVATFRTEPFQE